MYVPMEWKWLKHTIDFKFCALFYRRSCFSDARVCVCVCSSATWVQEVPLEQGQRINRKRCRELTGSSRWRRSIAGRGNSWRYVVCVVWHVSTVSSLQCWRLWAAPADEKLKCFLLIRQRDRRGHSAC